MEGPPYLRRRVASCLCHRAVLSASDDEARRKPVTAGVPQGSVLGPSLWNAMYDGVLKLELPEGTETIAFADDLALIVVAKTTTSLKLKCEKALSLIGQWLSEAGLALAKEKTEAILFTRKRSLPAPSIRVDGHRVRFSRTLKYLGVTLDDKLSFVKHTEEAAAKAATVARDLARLMPNLKGPKTSRRRLYNEVVHSVLLYGAPVWSEAVSGGRSMKKATLNLSRIQRRSALRVAAAYNTTSGDAILAVTGIPPVELLARERKAVHNGLAPKRAREATLEAWQKRWSDPANTKGRWTRRLIEDLKPWVQRPHGGLSFHLTQLLTGHGCFAAYLHRFQKITTSECLHCGADVDDAAHTISDCPAWSEERNRLIDAIGVPTASPDTMVRTMLESREGWTAWAEFARTVMSKKEEADRERQRLAAGGRPP